MQDHLGGIKPATEERRELQAEIDTGAFHAYVLGNLVLAQQFLCRMDKLYITRSFH